jgi:hypothetical protein
VRRAGQLFTVEAAGFDLPVICTPEELMENDNEQSD